MLQNHVHSDGKLLLKTRLFVVAGTGRARGAVAPPRKLLAEQVDILLPDFCVKSNLRPIQCAKLAYIYL